MIKQLLISCVALLVSVSAQAGVKIEHWTASTGAEVYFVQTDVLPILDIQIDFPAGAARDPVGKSGLASLTSGLLDSGAGGLDEETIAMRTVALGAKLGGSSDDDRSSVSLRTLAEPKKKDAALDLLHTILTQPTFPAEPMMREKTRAIAALKEAETRPDYIAAKAFSAAMYPGHPYGQVASVASVDSITAADIKAFYSSHYRAKGAIVSMIGAIPRAEAEQIAERMTRDLPQGEAAASLPPVTLPQKTLLNIAHPAQQAHINIGLPAVKRSDPEYYALLVGNYSLGGGGFVSRLMKEVREKRGYAYSVYSYFAPKKLEGPFMIGLQTKREQAEPALELVNSILTEFLAKGPTEAELKAAKQNLVDGLALRIDSNAKLLGYISAIGFYNLPLTYLDDYPKLINSITTKQVREAFARHVKPENLVTVIVAGSKDDKKEK